MKIDIYSAKALVKTGFSLVKDSKSKIIHSVHKETGETKISYKTQYLLQCDENPYDQRKVSAAISKDLVKYNGGSMGDIPECFQWSTLQNNC